MEGAPMIYLFAFLAVLGAALGVAMIVRGLTVRK